MIQISKEMAVKWQSKQLPAKALLSRKSGSSSICLSAFQLAHLGACQFVWNGIGWHSLINYCKSLGLTTCSSNSLTVPLKTLWTNFSSLWPILASFGKLLPEPIVVPSHSKIGWLWPAPTRVGKTRAAWFNLVYPVPWAPWAVHRFVHLSGKR